MRNEFSSRNRDYFIRFLRAFNGKAKLCMCYLNGIALSGALCVEYAGTMSYVYGCSAEKHRELMPNYLMQWTMIKKATENGCRIYDFCGIPYWYDSKHKNHGVYKFKSGFCGEIKVYAGEYDYVFRPFICSLFRLALKLKKIFLRKINFTTYKIKKFIKK